MTKRTELLGKMADELVQAKNHVALGKKEEARLIRQVEALVQSAAHWGQTARSAGRAGDDVVAKDALVRKGEHEAAAEDVRRALVRQRDEVLRLTGGLSDLSIRFKRLEGEQEVTLELAEREVTPRELDERPLLKELAKTSVPQPKKPLAKTDNRRPAEGARARAAASRDRRTKR